MSQRPPARRPARNAVRWSRVARVRCSCARHLGLENIAAVANGADDRRSLGVRLQLVAKAAYQGVDAAIVRGVRPPTSKIKQLIPCQYALGVLHECEQEVEFPAGKQHERVVGRTQLSPCNVETPIAEAH